MKKYCISILIISLVVLSLSGCSGFSSIYKAGAEIGGSLNKGESKYTEKESDYTYDYATDNHYENFDTDDSSSYKKDKLNELEEVEKEIIKELKNRYNTEIIVTYGDLKNNYTSGDTIVFHEINNPDLNLEACLKDGVIYDELYGIKTREDVTNFYTSIFENELDGDFYGSLNVVGLVDSDKLLEKNFSEIVDDGFYAYTLNDTAMLNIMGNVYIVSDMDSLDLDRKIESLTNTLESTNPYISYKINVDVVNSDDLYLLKEKIQKERDAEMGLPNYNPVQLDTLHTYMVIFAK